MPGRLQETSGTFANAPFGTEILINMSQGGQPSILAKRKPILSLVSTTVEAVEQSRPKDSHSGNVYWAPTLFRIWKKRPCNGLMSAFV